MASLITNTGGTTYTMKINTQDASGFPAAAGTESSGTLGNVTISEANQQNETNYQIDGQGTVINASFDLNFTLASTLTAGHRLGFLLEVETASTEFNYSTAAISTFFDAATDVPFNNTTAIWQKTGTQLVAGTEYTTTITIQYIKTEHLAGDNITFKAYFFDYDGTDVTADTMSSSNVTITVYSSVITPVVTTLDGTLAAKTAFSLGENIVFKTTLTPTTAQYYKKSNKISFNQIAPDLITLTKVYASVTDANTIADSKPSGSTELVGAFTGSVVNYEFTAAAYNDGTDTTVIPTLYVWVFGTTAPAPGTLPTAPVA